MPEVVTKYPNLLLKELKEAGIKCGQSHKKLILTTCPDDQFCSLPTGEICVYGLKDVPKLSQIQALDLFSFSDFTITFGSLSLMIFLLGVLIGFKFKKSSAKEINNIKFGR